MHDELNQARQALLDGDGGAVEVIERLARAGHAEAQREMIEVARREGREPEAEFWRQKLQEAASSGDSAALNLLSLCYRFADAFDRDVTKADELLLQAAHAGDPDAQFHLAMYLRWGTYSFPVDQDGSEFWLEKAIEQDFPDALYERATSLLQREPAPIDEARRLLERAAARGSSAAVEALARLDDERDDE